MQTKWPMHSLAAAEPMARTVEERVERDGIGRDVGGADQLFVDG